MYYQTPFLLLQGWTLKKHFFSRLCLIKLHNCCIPAASLKHESETCMFANHSMAYSGNPI